MKYLRLVSDFLIGIFLAGCSPLEQQTYRVIVSSNAFLRVIDSKHAECSSPDQRDETCDLLRRAHAAKDALIDATEVYCAGPDFDTGGKCNHPAKGTPGAQQATAKLQSEIGRAHV